ncbi:MAG: hypothetical protein DRR16_25325 [Candidatus Parabeggiatoa sp. nov. 3]|jgi:hypothetical protein|nr:MAG: hypothetical protein DRR00_11610 [Gammaproteobacteria bacterium]RKZ79652.1 MAG: hypothetical protein DRR16_25325 [Gammaproteobacteria bacterium]
MSDYQIRFDPRLEINPADFVAAWNDSADYKTVAEAQTDSAAVDFDSSAAKALTLLCGIAIGVTTNTVYDLIKSIVINLPTVQKTLATQTLPERTEFVDIQQIEQPDGTTLLIVIMKEH